MGILENIHCHDDLLSITDEERVQLCKEIREFLSRVVRPERMAMAVIDPIEEDEA